MLAGISMKNEIEDILVVVVLGFYLPPTAKVIPRQDLGLKSNLKDSRPLVYKASSLTTTPRRLLIEDIYS